MRIMRFYMCLGFFALALPLAVWAQNSPVCNTKLRDAASYASCTPDTACRNFKYSQGCASYEETLPERYFYTCKDGGNSGNDCVNDPTEIKCSDVYNCINPLPLPPEGMDGPCRRGEKATNPQGEVIFRKTKDIAVGRTCVVPPPTGPTAPPTQ